MNTEIFPSFILDLVIGLCSIALLLDVPGPAPSLSLHALLDLVTGLEFH